MKKLLLLAAALLLAASLPAQQSPPTVSASLSASDSGACSTANACLVINFQSATATSVVQLGGTFSATAQFEMQAAPNGPWVLIQMNPLAGGSGGTSTTTTGSWSAAVAGIAALRVRISAYASGAVVANITQSPVAGTSMGGSVSINGARVRNPNFQDSGSYFYDVVGNDIQTMPQLAVTGNGIAILNGNFEAPTFDQTGATQPIPPVGWGDLVPAPAGSTQSLDTTTPPPNSAFSFKMHCTSSASIQCVTISNTFWTVVPGQTYTLTAYARSDGTAPAAICLLYTIGDNVIGDQNYCVQTLSTTWTLLTVTGTVTGTQDTGELDLANGMLTTGSVAGDIWFNDVQLYANNVVGGLIPTGVTVASLPSASSNPLMIQAVNDSTTIAAEGQTCVGSSSTKALAFSNGVLWKCF